MASLVSVVVIAGTSRVGATSIRVIVLCAEVIGAGHGASANTSGGRAVGVRVRRTEVVLPRRTVGIGIGRTVVIGVRGPKAGVAGVRRSVAGGTGVGGAVVSAR